MYPRAGILVAAIPALTFSALGFSQAQPADRLLSPIVASQRAVTNTVSPLATRQNDRGRVAGSQVFHRMVLLLQRSPQQEAALQQLLAAQRDPKSPQYHKWLTPAQFGQQFGPSGDDLTKIEGWLKGQGFSVEPVPNGRGYIDTSRTTIERSE